jgi:hypothetical protein
MIQVLVTDATGHAVAPAGASDVVENAVAGDRLWRWDDASVAAGVSWHYRLVAVDTTGNASPMSAVTVARAVDRTPPSPRCG